MLWPERIKFSCNQVFPSFQAISLWLNFQKWFKVLNDVSCQFILNFTINIINIIFILSFAGCFYHSTLGWASIRDVQSGLVKPEQVISSPSNAKSNVFAEHPLHLILLQIVLGNNEFVQIENFFYKFKISFVPDCSGGTKCSVSSSGWRWHSAREVSSTWAELFRVVTSFGEMYSVCLSLSLIMFFSTTGALGVVTV